MEYILGLTYIIGYPIFGGMLYIVFPSVVIMYALGLAGFFGIIPQELSYKLMQPLGIITIMTVNVVFQLCIIYKVYKLVLKNECGSGV